MTTKIDDSELRRRVLAELDFEPTVDASTIGVAAKDGVVTLSGTVPSYVQKKNAEQAAKRVAGVKGVAEDLVIRLPGEFQRSDTEIAQSLLQALRFNLGVPRDKVQVTVEDGWVTLDGMVEWQVQKNAAENIVRYMMGVKGVTNRISLRPRVDAANVKAKIESAFTRHARLDSNRISVSATDSKVVLRGTVSTWREREDAEHAAWSAPGVSKVENNVTVSSW
jgi:osmotically-inducible protein OsmY